MNRVRVAAVAVLVIGCEREPLSSATVGAMSARNVEVRSPGAVSSTKPLVRGSGWLRVLRGVLAEVEVERAGYDAGERDHFYVRIRVRNVAARPIAVDLRARRRGMYVNQWEKSTLAYRTVVNERRAIQQPIDDAAAAELRSAMASGELAGIPVHGVLELYGSFNAGGCATVDAQPGRWLLVAIDGRFAITDGTIVDDLRIGDDETTRIVAIPAPVVWQPLPADARRLAD